MIRFCPVDVLECTGFGGAFGGGASLTKRCRALLIPHHFRLLSRSVGMAWIQRASRTTRDFQARQLALAPHPNPLPAWAGRGGPSAALWPQDIPLSALETINNRYPGQPG